MKPYLLVRPLVSHDTDSLHGQQDSERLADLVIQSCLAYLFDVYVICVLKNLDLLARYRAEDTDGESRSWEGVALDKV